MSNVKGSWARPVQGVSQQPPKLLKEGQSLVVDNMIPDPVSGLTKRTGTDHIAKLLDTLHQDAKIHHYVRDSQEEYFVVLEPDGTPKVFGADGTQHVVTVVNGADYCSTTNPKSELAMQTIADYTFIVNKGEQVLVASDQSAAVVEEAMVYVQYGFYGRKYKVIIDGAEVASSHTPDGSISSHIDLVATDYVCSQLLSGTIWTGAHLEAAGELVYETVGGDPPTSELVGIRTALSPSADITFIAIGGTQYIVGVDGVTFTGGYVYIPGLFAPGTVVDVYYKIPSSGGLASLAGFVVTRYGDSLHIKRADGAPFEVRTEDGAQGKDLIAIKGTVTSVGELPPVAPAGFIIKVKGAGKSEDDSFYLKAVARDGNQTVWVETLAPSTKYKFNAATMPHTLVRESVDVEGVATFVLDRGEWVDRDVGAEDSNPFPAFADQSTPTTIQSVGIFQNRLFFTSGETVSMTRTGRFFDFFRQSTQATADDDPIDVYSDSAQVSNLLHSVSLDGDLVFFSPNAQFVLKGDKPVTKATATLKQSNTFKVQVGAAPVPAGEYVYFAYDAGAFSGVREFFTDSVVDTKRARPVTEHVNKYIKGKVRGMSASTNQNWLLVLSTGERNVVYVYNWLWAGSEKLQSAWHRWVWPADEEVLYATFSNDVIHLFIKRAEGVYLESLDIGDLNSEGLTFPVRLDRKHALAALKVGDRWEFDDLFPEESTDNLEYVLAFGCYPEDVGTTCTFERSGDKLITYDNISALGVCQLVGGKKYTSTWVPGQALVKDYQGRIIESDTLRVQQVWLNYEKTGHILVTVSDTDGNSEVNEFNGRVFGDSNNLVGFAPLTDGTFNFPVMQESDKFTISISSSSHLPLQVRDMEFSGQFTQRGKRI